MQLPRVKIQFLNGQLGTVGESADGLVAIVCGAAAVQGGLTLNTPYTLYSMDDLAELGVTAENNAELYRQVSLFYDETGAGVKLVIYPVAPATTMTVLCDYTQTAAGKVRDLITRMNGQLRAVFVANVNTGSSAASTNGIDPDVLTAVPKAQQLAEWATTELYAPLFFVLEGRKYDAAKTLTALTQKECDRVAVLIGDTVSDSEGACIGTLAGRIASTQVQRNIGRVKDGSLALTEAYIGDKAVEEAQSLVASIHENGYITLRRYVGRSGYFFTDDPLATSETDDYAHITARRVSDKAYRLAYDTLLDMLLDELEVNTDGTLLPAVARSWEQTVTNVINRSMTANGELSAGEDGDGCQCYVDDQQNVLATSNVKVTLKVRPHGYGRYVDVNLGFLVNS